MFRIRNGEMNIQYLEYAYNPYNQIIDDDVLHKSSSSKQCPNKSDAIKSVKELIQKSNDLPTKKISDEFIMKFLHARKTDANASFQLMVNYFKYRTNNPSIFTNLTAKDPSIQLAFRDGLPIIVKNRDRRGRRVIVFLVYQWDHAKYSFESIYRALILTLEYLLEDVTNQVNGFVFIVDWTNFRLRDSVDLTPRIVKKIIDGFQDCFPAKIKAMHFIGQPWYLDGILLLIKSFLKEKTKNKLIMHGTNLSTLHEYLPPDVLPTELGGEGGTYSPIEWIDYLCRSNKDFQ